MAMNANKQNLLHQSALEHNPADINLTKLSDYLFWNHSNSICPNFFHSLQMQLPHSQIKQKQHATLESMPPGFPSLGWPLSYKPLISRYRHSRFAKRERSPQKRSLSNNNSNICETCTIWLWNSKVLTTTHTHSNTYSKPYWTLKYVAPHFHNHNDAAGYALAW